MSMHLCMSMGAASGGFKCWGCGPLPFSETTFKNKTKRKQRHKAKTHDWRVFCYFSIFCHIYIVILMVTDLPFTMVRVGVKLAALSPEKLRSASGCGLSPSTTVDTKSPPVFDTYRKVG